MANSARRAINYKPRMTDAEAYEHLGPRVRRALQEAVTDYSAYWCLRMVRKHGADFVVNAIRSGDETFCKKGFVPARGKRPAVASSLIACKVSILRSNWAAA